MVKTSTKWSTSLRTYGAVLFALVMLFSVTPGIAAQASTKKSAVAAAQAKRTIKGVVNDEDGYPLIGASVLLMDGGNTAALTDLNGAFSIDVPTKGEVVLKVSFLGMISQDIVVTPKMKDLDITLNLDTKSIDELVVTGYRTISKERSTGSASIISKEKLTKVATQNIASNLEGMVPGLTVEKDGTMSIRGTSSLSLNAQPLVVIDGMPVENISNAGISSTGLGLVNPADVESIVVLKDATATSLYGIRATNGVIVVTTKKGTTKKPVVNISANYYVTQNSDFKNMNYASTADIVDYEVEYLLNDPDYIADPFNYFVYVKTYGTAPQYVSAVDNLYFQMAAGEMTQDDVNKQLDVLKGRDYRQEFQDNFAKTALVQDYNLSISQGSDFAQTYFSARYQDNNPNSIDAESNKIALNLNNTFKFMRWFKLNTGLSMNIDNSTNKNLSYCGRDNFLPYYQILDDEGERVQLYPYNAFLAEGYAENSSVQPMGYNVLDDLESGSYSAQQDIYLKFMTSAEVKIMKGLSLDLRFQYETINGKDEAYSSVESYSMRELINKFTQEVDSGYGYNMYTYNVPVGGKLSESDKQLRNLTFRSQLNYDTKIGDKHTITALAGFEARENKIRYTAHDRYGYDDQTLAYQYVDQKLLSTAGVAGMLYPNQNLQLPINMGIQDAMHRYISAYANASYNYDNKYSLTGNVRMDQADLFGSDPRYRYRPLWSLGAGWNVNNEGFMADATEVDMLKLRATYGITGNVDQSSTPYLVGSMATSPETGGGFTEITTPPNKLLRWEKTSTFNVGVDVAAFQRLTASVDVYNKYGSDLLAPKRYDPTMGFASGRVNNGAMSNKGIELFVSYDWIKNGDWRFNTQVTAAYNKSTVEYIDYVPKSALDLLQNPYGYYLEGTARGTLYAYDYVGLNEVGDPIIKNENGEEVSNIAVTSIDAVKAVGQLTPKVQGMVNLTLGYKNFELFSRFVYYTGHNMRYDAMPLYQGVGSGGIHRDIVNRWTPENTDTDIPSINKYGYDANREDHWRYADTHILDASYLKARNIGLTYSFPKEKLANIGFKSLILRAQVDDLFYIAANDEGIDPEAYNLSSGIRYAKIMPTYTFGVNVSF